jgi:NifU-like protein involved in Fe-S cluster formation
MRPVKGDCRFAFQFLANGIQVQFAGRLRAPMYRPMSADLYSPRVLELAASIPLTGPVAGQAVQAHRVSRLCGSEVEVGLTVEGGVITGFAIDPRACALGQASASVLAHNVVGATPGEVRAARDSLAAMLKSGAPAPAGRFWELRYLEPVRDYPPRHTSTLLAFDAAVDALERAALSQVATPG